MTDPGPADKAARPPVAGASCSISDALTSVHYSAARERFLAALWCGRPHNVKVPIVGDRTDRDAVLETGTAPPTAPSESFAWAGGIPDKAGRYVIANPYALDGVPVGQPEMLDLGRGLSDGDVRWITSVL